MPVMIWGCFVCFAVVCLWFLCWLFVDYSFVWSLIFQIFENFGHFRGARERQRLAKAARLEETQGMSKPLGLRKCPISFFRYSFVLFSIVWCRIFRIFQNPGHFRTARSGVYIV